MGLNKDFDENQFSTDLNYDEDVDNIEPIDDALHRKQVRKLLEEKLEKKRLREELEDELDGDFDWDDY